MAHLLGIDFGTSSVKALLTDTDGRRLAVAAREYPIYTPQPGYAEQNAEEWWTAAQEAVREVISSNPGIDVKAIGLCGQMHGGVLIDKKGAPVSPAIIWADQRTTAEVEFMKATFGAEALAQIVGTLPATGFMGPILLWLKEHQPEVLERAATFLLPKDYARLKLTGTVGTDASDASATALFDVRKRDWSEAVVSRLGLPAHLLPKVSESGDIVGGLLPDAAAALGLRAGIPVAAGSADQAAQGVGNGLLNPGFGSVTLGTGGQVVAPLTEPAIDPQLHTFCHALPDRWYVMGAMLAAGLSLRWLRNLLDLQNNAHAYEGLAQLAAQTSPGTDGLLFLPYLIGERSPLNDPLASGTFVGLSLPHQRGHLARAIMEGVAFALRQIIETMGARGIQPERFLAAGNGLGSPVWRQIAADILGRPLALSSGGEHTALGAALVAAKGAGLINDFPPPAISDQITEPNLALTAFYTERYELFKETYSQLEDIMHRLKANLV
jgi:xylulokinase